MSAGKGKILFYCINRKINLVVIGPEKYLEMGIVDLLEENNINCIGPNKLLAQIETNKYFMRNLFTENVLNPYNPKYQHFESLNTSANIKNYIMFCKQLNFNYVIKPTGLCSGKGVYVSRIHFENDLEGLNYSLDILEKGQTVLIEEKLIGNEFTLMSYSDGTYLSHMPIVLDFKLLESGNKGPNTGSMGSITHKTHGAPFLNKEDILLVQRLNKKTIDLLKKNIIKNTRALYMEVI